MNNGEVSRRSALKYLSLLAASAAGRTFLASWLPISTVQAGGQNNLVTIQAINNAEAETAVAYAPQFFKPDQFKTVELLTEVILPTDDEPGAKEAQVGNYIDFVVFSAREFEPTLQKEWLTGLEFLDRESRNRYGRAFRFVTDADRAELLTDMSLPERDPKAHREGYEFFQLVKDMTVEGFYTSRVGLMDVLNYQGMNYESEFPGCTHPEHQS